MIGLCDCNNFFVSCERVFNPALNGKPVVVLSNNDGCIVSRSNEAKALGIKMGIPLYQIREFAEKNQVAVYSSNYTLYGDMSARVINSLRQHIPAIEVYSIDEAFLDYSGFPLESLQEKARELSKLIKHNTGIPVSIGVAPTKTLAKIASKLCKKYPALKGGCLLYKIPDIEKVLKKVAVEDIWGVGRRHAAMLHSYQVLTAYDFYMLAPQWVKQKMNITGLCTWRELHTEPCIDFEQNLPDKQSICVSRSFARELSLADELLTALSNFTATACEKLRKQNSLTSQVQVFILTNRHHANDPQSYDSCVVRLNAPTDSTLEIIEIVKRSLKQIFKSGYSYKRAGILLTDIESRIHVQGLLFEQTPTLPKHDNLMQAIDEINAKMGHSMVALGSQSKQLSINRQYVSARYSTSLDECIEVKV